MLKIAISGPEAAGKTSLAEALIQLYPGRLVTEYAREYFANFKGTYQMADVENIALGQLKSENTAINQLHENETLIADTDLTVIEIWLEHKYGCCPFWIKEHNRKAIFDAYLLMKPDLAWEYDPLRESEHNRDELFEMYEQLFIKCGKKYRIISGTNRLEQAQDYLAFLERKK